MEETLDWKAACAQLSRADPLIGALIRRYPGERLEASPDCFRTLANAIVGQQISVRAAEAIWRRLLAACEPFSPASVAAADDGTLRAAGLSLRKVDYLRGIGEAFGSGRVSSELLRGLDDRAALDALDVLHGVGRWTAEMVLIFHLTRPDLLPTGDIGLLRIAAATFGWKPDDPKAAAKKLLARAERWRPWRTVACWYLWRDLDPEPVIY
ncbi:MAG: DNA-3-methyladenine glycosylase 2 family protein [Spirochaetota bacterium]